MRVGVPKEIKNHEYRVGMIPAAVRELTARGHEVFVETNAGEGIGLAHVRALVRRLGGEITVESEFGRGSKFKVRLPKYLTVNTETKEA